MERKEGEEVRCEVGFCWSRPPGRESAASCAAGAQGGAARAEEGRGRRSPRPERVVVVTGSGRAAPKKA